MCEPMFFVGIDWASTKHDVCVLDRDEQVIFEGQFKHSGEGLAALSDKLASLGENEAVAVGIEISHGPVIEELLGRGFQVWSLNPKQLDRFRDRFSMSGAKDDRRDAFVLAHSLMTDRRCFRRIKCEEEKIVELREWSRMRAEVIEERTRELTRLQQQLRRYFPAFLEVSSDLTKDWVLMIWKTVETPEGARRVRPSAIAAILRKQRVRKVPAQELVQKLRARPLTLMPGTQSAAVSHCRLIVQRLEQLNDQLRECDRYLRRFFESLPRAEPREAEPTERNEQRDFEILLSLPGIGRIVCATLLAEAAELLRARDYHALRALSGVAPVTIRSGKKLFKVVMRRACNQRLRTACYHWGRVAMQRDVALPNANTGAYVPQAILTAPLCDLLSIGFYGSSVPCSATTRSTIQADSHSLPSSTSTVGEKSRRSSGGEST